MVPRFQRFCKLLLIAGSRRTQVIVYDGYLSSSEAAKNLKSLVLHDSSIASARIFRTLQRTVVSIHPCHDSDSSRNFTKKHYYKPKFVMQRKQNWNDSKYFCGGDSVYENL